MKKKYITYKIEITCEENSKGVIIPFSSISHLEDEKGNAINLVKYPDIMKIMLIWIGKYYQYPFKK